MPKKPTSFSWDDPDMQKYRVKKKKSKPKAKPQSRTSSSRAKDDTKKDWQVKGGLPAHIRARHLKAKEAGEY